MARIYHSLLNGVSGRFGNVVSSSRNGVAYLKSAHKKRTKKISIKEKANRRRFKLAQEWLKPVTQFVRVGFKGYSPTVQGFIAAKSYLMKNAMDANGTVDPTLARVSFGTLSNSGN